MDIGHIGLPPHLAGRVSNYDFWHAFITHLASRGASLAGLLRLAGHKHVYTTARYIHARGRPQRNPYRCSRRTP